MSHLLVLIHLPPRRLTSYITEKYDILRFAVLFDCEQIAIVIGDGGTTPVFVQDATEYINGSNVGLLGRYTYQVGADGLVPSAGHLRCFESA